jgi:hypothetical protein
MAHFAEIDSENIVLRVLVISNEFETTGHEYLSNVLGLGGSWIQTSYNGNMRKNFAGIGYTYDATRDAFIAPEPNDAIGFDEKTCQWIVPERDFPRETPPL